MPTFGITVGGGSTFPTTNDRAILSKFTAPASGTVTQINQRFRSTSAAGDNFKGLIYSDSGGVPGTRLGIGSAVSVPAGGGDLASTGLSVSITGGVDYWIGSVVDAFNSVWECDAGGTGLSRMEAVTYASPAATWTQSGTGVATVNVYATYVSGPTITQQPLSQRLPAGGSPVFTVSATGTGGLSYQWYSNASGTFVAVGTNSATYSPSALAAGDRYDVYCDVTDSISTTRTLYAAAWAPTAEPSAWRGVYSRGGRGRGVVLPFGLTPTSKAAALALADALLGPAAAAGSATVNGQTLTATASVIPGSVTGAADVAGQTATVNATVIAGAVQAAATVSGQVVTALASVIEGAVTGAADVAGQTATVNASVLAGTASGGGATVVNGQTLTVNASVIAGTVEAAALVDSQVITVVASAIAGTVEAAATIAGQLLTSTASVIAGTVTGAADVAGQTLTVNASVLPGAASGGGSAVVNGQTLTVTASAIEGAVTGAAAVDGQLLTVVASVLAGSAFVPGAGDVTPSQPLRSGIGLGL